MQIQRQKNAVRRQAELAELARKLFGASGKNPYFLGSKAIRNFSELKNSLNDFTGREANWVADWIEYLGDGETARRLRMAPSNFKRIISERHDELKSYWRS